MSTQDRVRLSAKERHQLANIEAELRTADPRLATVLEERRRRSQDGRAKRRWAGPLTLCVGFALIFATISSYVWLSLAGALIAGAGLELSALAWKDGRALRSPRSAGAPGLPPSNDQR
jgi:hypothetical protein